MRCVIVFLATLIMPINMHATEHLPAGHEGFMILKASACGDSLTEEVRVDQQKKQVYFIKIIKHNEAIIAYQVITNDPERALFRTYTLIDGGWQLFEAQDIDVDNLGDKKLESVKKAESLIKSAIENAGGPELVNVYRTDCRSTKSLF